MATAAPVEKIDVGRVISRGFEALRANFVSFFICSVLLSGVPVFLLQYASLASISSGTTIEYVESGAFALVAIGGALAWLIGIMVLQGIMTRATIMTLSGRGADMAQSVLTALRLILPIVAVSLLVGIAVVIGFLFLIVPGIMIYCAFSVSIPALVEERRGVFASMQRSRDLTRNSRKRIFLLLVVMWVFSVIISTILNAISGTDPMSMFMGRLPDPLLAATTAGLGSALNSVISAVMLAALYVELRTVKEGATTDDLAAIFA